MNSNTCLIKSLKSFNDDYNRKQYLSQNYKMYDFSNEGSILNIISTFKDDYYKKEAINLLKVSCNKITFNEAFQIIRSVRDNYYKFEFIKILQNRFISPNDVINVVNSVNDNYYKYEILKFFSTFFCNFKDVKNAIICLPDIYHKNGFIKLVKNKLNNIQIANLVNCFNFESISDFFYIKNQETLSEIIFELKTDDHKVELLEAYSSYVDKIVLQKALLVINDFCDQFYIIKNFIIKITSCDASELVKVVNGDTEKDDDNRIKLLKFLFEKFGSENIKVFPNDFKTEKGRVWSIKYCDYFDPINFVEILKIFNSDYGKYKFLKKCVNLNQNIVNSIFEIIDHFQGHEYQKNVVKFLLSQQYFSASVLSQLLEKFPIPDRFMLAVACLKKSEHSRDDVILWLPKLDSNSEAKNILEHFTYSNIEDLLKQSGYNIDVINDINCNYESESESESDSDSDSELDCEFDLSQKFLNFHISEFDLDRTSKKYAKYAFPTGKIRFNVARNRVESNDMNFYQININGVNVVREVYDQVQQQILYKINVYQRKKMEINKLKIQNDWKDVKLTDDDDKMCNICMSNRKQIIFNCGHYHTCFKCSRKIIKGNCKCPMCKSEITTANRVFD